MATPLAWKKIVAAAYLAVIEQRSQLVGILAIPFAILLLMATITIALDHPYVRLIVYPAVLVAETMIAVSVHRLVLLGNHSISKWSALSLTKREAKFAAHIVLVSFVASLTAVLAVIPVIGAVMALVGFVWV